MPLLTKSVDRMAVCSVLKPEQCLMESWVKGKSVEGKTLKARKFWKVIYTLMPEGVS